MSHAKDDAKGTRTSDENRIETSLSTDLWTETDALFKAALEQPPETRAAFVGSATASDTIKRDVLRLLRADEAAGSFLEKPLIATPTHQEQDDRRRHIGPYRLIGVAGTGGMGTVYLAERDDDAFDRRVVIKVLRHDTTSTAYRRHLESERRHLARLEHPNVARLYDGGTTEDGHPYLVIEHVEGEPLDVYCAHHAPTIDDRLDLFLQLCDAVAFAHHHLLIHCDLKPANVLVVAPDQEQPARVKLLDFGIARLRSADRTHEPPNHPAAMTPRYASPEQRCGETLSIGTDVYSLGVMLHELLTGQVPASLPPSSVASRSGAGRRPRQLPVAVDAEPHDAEPHDAEPGSRLLPVSIPSAWRRDLEHIIDRAVAPSPEARYDSVSRLADDLRRCRADRPIDAAPPSWIDRSRKALRRNRADMFTLVAVAVGVAAVVVVLLIRNHDLDRAHRQTTGIEDLLEQMIASANPRTAEKGDAPTALSIIDQGAEALAKGLPDPRSEARLAISVARAYADIGREQRAARVIAETIDRLAPRMTDMTPETTELAGLLGVSLMRMGHVDDAEIVLLAVVQHWRELMGDDHPEVYLAQGPLANVLRLQGRLDEAETLASSALRAARPLLQDDVRLARLQTVKGFVLMHLNLETEAETLLREALAHRQRILGPRHVEVAASLNNLGTALAQQDRSREAMAAWREALDIWEERLPDQAHPMVATTLHNVASSALDERDLHTAEETARRSIALGNAAYEDLEADFAPTVGILTHVLRLRGHLEQAEAMAVRELDAIDLDASPPLSAAAPALTRMAHVLVEQGKFDEALATLDRATTFQDETLPPEARSRSYALLVRGHLASKQGDHAGALTWYRRAHALRVGLKPGHWLRAETGGAIGATFLAVGRPERAHPYLDDAHTILSRRFGDDDDRTRDMRGLLDAATRGMSTTVTLHPRTPGT